jgi:hypothetical protein
MMSRAKAPTKAERERLARVAELGCLLCHRLGRFRPAEIHHLLDGGVRRGHSYTIGACSWHHRGVPLDGENVAMTTLILGPSLALGSQIFRAFWGNDDALLAETDRLLLEAA